MAKNKILDQMPIERSLYVDDTCEFFEEELDLDETLPEFYSAVELFMRILKRDIGIEKYQFPFGKE